MNNAINAAKAAKSAEEIAATQAAYDAAYNALVAETSIEAVICASTDENILTLGQEYITTLASQKEKFKTTQTQEEKTVETQQPATQQPAKKEGLMARMKASAKAGAHRTVQSAKAGHEAGKLYVMYVTDKFGRFLGIHKDTDEEGLMANLKKYGKLAVYYTVYAVIAVPMYTSVFIAQFTLGLFGKSLDLAKVKAELEANGKLVKKGEATQTN